MNTPTHLKYAASHEWARLEADGSVTIGITDHAQEALGDLVFVELPAIGKKVKMGEVLTVVESVKAASDVYSPVAGTVVAVNPALQGAPETVNSAPYEGGWMIKLKVADPAEAAALLDAAAYAKQIA